MRDDQINAILRSLRDSLHKQSDRVLSAFQSVDKDRSGNLSPEEFAACLAKFGIRLPTKDLAAVVSKFDSNGDGTVSYAEFNTVVSGNFNEMNLIKHETQEALRNSGMELRPPSSAGSVRPQSAMPRLGTPPAGELRRVPTPQQIDTFLATNTRPNPRPRSAYPTVAKRYIYGELGPAMDGVIHYPYSASQRLYRDDFESMVMASITHPYCRTAKANTSSLPHDILSGSNFDDGRISNLSSWRSECFRQYVPKNSNAARGTLATGVRSELTRFIG